MRQNNELKAEQAKILAQVAEANEKVEQVQKEHEQTKLELEKMTKLYNQAVSGGTDAY